MTTPMDKAMRDMREATIEQCARLADTYCYSHVPEGDLLLNVLDGVSKHIAADIRALSQSSKPPDALEELRAWANYNKSPPHAGSNTREAWPEILLAYLNGKKPQQVMEAVEFYKANSDQSSKPPAVPSEQELREILAEVMALRYGAKDQTVLDVLSNYMDAVDVYGPDVLAAMHELARRMVKP